MHAYFKIDTVSTPRESVNLAFMADTVFVTNPTASSIGISIGGNITPTAIADSDIWIPPSTTLSYPVRGSVFAVAFIPPLLVNAPSGIPTTAIVTFLSLEQTPQGGALPLSTLATQALSDVVLLPQSNIPTGGTVFFTVPITPDIVSLTMYQTAVQNVQSIQVSGIQSGIVYAKQDANTVFTPLAAQESVLISAIDTSLLVAATGKTTGLGATVRIVGHRYPVQPGLNVADNPAPYGVANPSWLHAPDYSVQGQVFSPATGAAFATLTVVNAGVYRLLFRAGSADIAGATKYMTPAIAGLEYTACPVPGHLELALPAISLLANTVLSLTVGAAGSDWYIGSIAAYRI